jgi:hypothetical protein
MIMLMLMLMLMLVLMRAGRREGERYRGRERGRGEMKQFRIASLCQLIVLKTFLITISPEGYQQLSARHLTYEPALLCLYGDEIIEYLAVATSSYDVAYRQTCLTMTAHMIVTHHKVCITLPIWCYRCRGIGWVWTGWQDEYGQCSAGSESRAVSSASPGDLYDAQGAA